MTRTIDAELLRTMPLPAIGAAADKDARGRVLIVGGGVEVPGAALLAGLAALRAGAGKLQMAATDDYAMPLAMAVPEARVIRAPGQGDLSCEAGERLVEAAKRCDAVAIGPGMIDEAASAALAARLLAEATETAFVVDAAAMTAIGEHADVAKAADRLVLTPHPGEMAALTGLSKEEVLADPLTCARAAAARFRAVVALKSRQTHVVTPDGRCWLHEDGVAGLATSGSGDVLAGVIGGLLARGASPAQATCWGVWLHGRAGARLSERIGPLGFLARELLDEIPRALAEV